MKAKNIVRKTVNENQKEELVNSFRKKWWRFSIPGLASHIHMDVLCLSKTEANSTEHTLYIHYMSYTLITLIPPRTFLSSILTVFFARRKIIVSPSFFCCKICTFVHIPYVMKQDMGRRAVRGCSAGPSLNGSSGTSMP